MEKPETVQTETVTYRRMASLMGWLS